MMTEQIAEDTSQLLRRLIEAFIDHPWDLAIDYRQLPGRVDWKVCGNINDQGKIVGRQGAHIKAVQFLLAEIGARHDQQFVLRLEEAKGERGPDVGRRPMNPSYSPSVARMLLVDILTAVLDEVPDVEVKRDPSGGSLLFTFEINARRIQDYERLVVPVEGGDQQTLITALGTLFRAAGHRDGVILKLEVPSR